MILSVHAQNKGELSLRASGQGPALRRPNDVMFIALFIIGPTSINMTELCEPCRRLCSNPMLVENLAAQVRPMGSNLYKLDEYRSGKAISLGTNGQKGYRRQQKGMQTLQLHFVRSCQILAVPAQANGGWSSVSRHISHPRLAESAVSQADRETSCVFGTTATH